MNIELKQLREWKANDRYWTFCVGSGHAALALRADYQKLLKQVCRELGFQRVRFHGIFHDDMQIVTTFHDLLPVAGSQHVKTVSFYQVAVIFDALLEAGIRPFVEIGFMPNALASKKKHVFYYKANVSPPKSYTEWSLLIRDFIIFLVERYGENEVQTWFFEVWNEPDLKGFFWTGAKEEYYRLYKVTVQAIRSVLPEANVGGPATSQNRWLHDFRSYCGKEGIPLSFLSTHHYPGDDIGLPLLTKDNLKRLLFTAKQNPGKRVHEVFHKMMVRNQVLPLIQKDSMQKQILQAKKEAGDIPLYYTEWNVNPTCTHKLHDHCASAAFIVKHVLDGQYCMAGCSFFTFSDIFEENTFFSEPFSGSFGLTTIYGIPKPGYWAFYFLNQLSESRLLLPITHDYVEYAVFAGGHKLQMLLYAQEYVQDNNYEDVHILLPFSCMHAVYSSINEEDTNPEARWKEMGSPNYLSRDQVEAIIQKSTPVETEIDVTVHAQRSELHIRILTNEVILIRLDVKEDMDEYIAKAKKDGV